MNDIDSAMHVLNTMRVTVPPGEYQGMRVEHFTVRGNTPLDFRYFIQGRPCAPGEYTKLRDETTLWMSDTTAERVDHLPAVTVMRSLRASRVLINGLGLGMVVQAALALDHVESIDVVERDERVIHLVGPHYTADPRVHIYHADALAQSRAWPRNTSWSVVWHDIWPTISDANLPEMTRLHRSYGSRCLWQGSWCHRRCQQLRRGMW